VKSSPARATQHHINKGLSLSIT